MTVLYYVTVVLHVMACLFLIGVVLLQQGKGQDLASAFGGGSGTQAAFGPRGQANVLSRATTILAALFMMTSLALTVLRPGASSVLDRIPAATASPSPAASVPGASVPAATPESPAAGAPNDAPVPAASPSPQ